MLFVVLCAIFVASADVALGRYQFKPSINKWIQYHRTATTWESAAKTCLREGGMLASPINMYVLDELQAYFGETPFYIGTHALFHPDIFQSVEGVLLDDMPLDGMYDSLDSENGRCLLISNSKIKTVPCSMRHPYACYRTQQENTKTTKCGTFDKGYIYEESTGSCYKYHYHFKTWEEAFATCVAEGGYLAIADDENEAKVIQKNINDTSYYMHIGIRDWFGKGTWMSVHGELVEQHFDTWVDNYKPKNTTSDRCAFYNPFTILYKDFPCSNLGYFICEKDSS